MQSDRRRRPSRCRGPWTHTPAVVVVLFAALCLSAAMSGCVGGVITPSGKVKTETREVGAFQHVALRGPGRLKIVPAKQSDLRITADDNLISAVKATVSGGTLVISLERNGQPVKVGPGAKLEMELRTPAITGIENSGSGEITGGPFSGTAFNVVDSGSGSVSLGKVEVVSLGAEITGSGSIDVEDGLVGAQEVVVSGSGSFSAPGLESRVSTVRVSGSGGVELWATEGLDATITGSGSVSYWGSPRLTEQTSGSGSVRSLGPK